MDIVWISRAFLIGLVLAGITTAALGITAGDVSFVPCPFRLVTGMPCPGCGMTRSVIALARGDLPGAWHFHPFSFALVALAIASATIPERASRAWNQLSAAVRATVLGAAIALVVVRWMLLLAS